MTERIVAYEPRFDREAYLSVLPVEKEKLNSYTKTQLETHLGERFNVLLSETRFEIKGEKIYGENSNEPFMDVLQRGVLYRRKNGDPVDFEREQAEADGFEKIQKELTGKETPLGTMMLSISPPGGEGSIYQHNFYDVFTLKKDEKGKYIEAIRYSSGVGIDEYVDKLKILKTYDKIPKDSDFLKDPIKVDTSSFADSDALHRFLHKEHDYITRKEFEEIKKITTPLALSIINNLSQRPWDEEKQIEGMRAYYNGADLAQKIIQTKGKGFYDFAQNKVFSEKDIYWLGQQPVRKTTTGCGISGDFSQPSLKSSIKSPYSVSEAGSFSDKYGSREFQCPDCHRTNVRPKDKLVSKCQHCQSKGVAC
jgi:ribosomal protein L37AE/L43A